MGKQAALDRILARNILERPCFMGSIGSAARAKRVAGRKLIRSAAKRARRRINGPAFSQLSREALGPPDPCALGAFTNAGWNGDGQKTHIE